jgi:16S rRNA pseudouridine516 synthase
LTDGKSTRLLAVDHERPMPRLDRLLSHAAGLTRSAARQLIRAGRVAIGDAVARDPAAQVDATASLRLAGRAIARPVPRYLMLHKPVGCVCATSDGLHPTVLDLLPAGERAGLHAAGRLDLDVTGLVLLTDDGAWSHRVTAPRRKCPKTYRAELAEPIAEEALAALRRGVALRGEARPTRPATVVRLGPAQVQITVTEGRYHLVKRMFAAVGNRVTALYRERIGPVALDPALPPGGWRALSAEEVDGLAVCGAPGEREEPHPPAAPGVR